MIKQMCYEHCTLSLLEWIIIFGINKPLYFERLVNSKNRIRPVSEDETISYEPMFRYFPHSLLF